MMEMSEHKSQTIGYSFPFKQQKESAPGTDSAFPITSKARQ